MQVLILATNGFWKRVKLLFPQGLAVNHAKFYDLA